MINDKLSLYRVMKERKGNMKLFHTADWHLGKLVQGIYMTEDQQYVLEQFIEDVKRERPDAIIIAGDLYDRAIPPTEAVELLNELLERLVLELRVPVFAIAGNHDSPDRIDFAVKLMERNGLYMCGQLRFPLKPIVMQDEYGEVHMYLLPYADPSIVRHLLGQEHIRSHQEAMEAIVASIIADWDTNARHVLVAHAFVTPYGEAELNSSDAERPLAIGGAEYVSAELLKAFDYVALGHLHGAHHVGNSRIRYSGSPLKYSISEEKQQKGYLVVELGKENVEVNKVGLVARRDMRRVIGNIAEIERHVRNEDYVYVTLTDENPVLFPMEKIRAVYPNAMHVERQAAKLHMIDEDGGAERASMLVKQELKPLELFAAFYGEVRGIEAYELLMKESGE
jgi:exonuclease SbcD